MMAHTFNGRNLLHSKVYTYCIHYTLYSIHYTIHFLPNIIANKKNCIHYNTLNGYNLFYKRCFIAMFTSAGKRR